LKVQVFHAHHAYLNQTPTLVDVSLSLHSGEFCFLIGASGAGKSTLFKLLFAEEKPNNGQILVNDWHVHQLTHRTRPFYRRNVGYIFQDLKLLTQRTAAENIALPLEAVGIKRSYQRQRVHHLLHRVGLGHCARSKIHQLSGGERQRIAIARALAHNPQFILADEPTGSLDPTLSKSIMDLLFEQSMRGVTVLVSTHDHSLLKRYNTRILCMEQGSIMSDYRN
jgi:cell division transport system ATP-binding protein